MSAFHPKLPLIGQWQLSTHCGHRPICYLSPAGGNRMRVHLLKPMHGWRQFAGEVGIIVLGVLIALAASQVVEAINDRNKMAESEDALAAEVAKNTARAVIRLRMTECVDRRLDQLGQWLDRASQAHRLPALGPIGRVRQVPLTSAAFASFIVSPLATSLPQTTLRSLREAYRYTEWLQEAQDRELGSWDVLWTMVGPGRSLSTVEEPQLRLAITNARSENLQAGILAANVVERVGMLDLPFTAQQRAALDIALHQPMQEIDFAEICTATRSRTPSHYGSSPSGSFLTFANKALHAGPRLGPAATNR
jgi:hypothetical protein